MTSANDIFENLCALAPLELQMSFDNSGFLFGRKNAGVTKALLALDVTPAVVEEAIGLGAELIVSHHPLIFSPLKSVTDEKLLRLAQHQIGVISMHTNLDIAQGGVNDRLAKALELIDPGPLENGLIRVGTLPQPMPLAEFVRFTAKALGCSGVRYADCGKPVFRVAVGGGACGDFEEDVLRSGCDTFVTADLSYHQFLNAPPKGLNLIDAGHFPTEDPICQVLTDYLTGRFAGLNAEKSTSHREVIQYYVEGD